MIPTDRQRAALESSLIPPAVRAREKARISNEEHRLTSTITATRSEQYASLVNRAAEAHEAIRRDEAKAKEIKARRDPADARELRRIRERQAAYRAAIDEFERAVEETARVAADPLAHANELLAKFPALGGA